MPHTMQSQQHILDHVFLALRLAAVAPRKAAQERTDGAQQTLV
jgi:hypothetical protein